TRTITMDTVGTRTVTMVAAVTDIAMAADQGISEVSGVGDKPVRVFEIVRQGQLCAHVPADVPDVRRGKTGSRCSSSKVRPVMSLRGTCSTNATFSFSSLRPCNTSC